MEGDHGSIAGPSPLLVLQGWTVRPTALLKGRTSRSPSHAGSSQAWWRRQMLATAACRPDGAPRWSLSRGPHASEQAEPGQCQAAPLPPAQRPVSEGKLLPPAPRPSSASPLHSSAQDLPPRCKTTSNPCHPQGAAQSCATANDY